MAALQRKAILRLVLFLPLLLLLRHQHLTSYSNSADKSKESSETKHININNLGFLRHGRMSSSYVNHDLNDLSVEKKSILGLGSRRSLLDTATNTIDVDKINSTEANNDNNNNRKANQNTGNVNFVEDDTSCNDVTRHVGYPDECSYVRARGSCHSGTLVEYLEFYYCTCKNFKFFGAAVLGLGLMALFFMLGNTAADYFCPSLEELSELLHLPPTVAGVTLLPLGNGAPDVFASIAAFVGAGEGQVGLNSVLGAGLFVSTIVAGSVSLVVANMGTNIHVDGVSFVRDVCFYLLSLVVLLIIIVIGRIHLAWAIAFLSIYFLYGISVGISEFLRVSRPQKREILLQPVSCSRLAEEDDSAWLYEPLLDPDVDVPNSGLEDTTNGAHGLPQWLWTSNVAIYSVHEGPHSPRPLWGWSEDEEQRPQASVCSFHGICEYLIKLPIMLPRRLTIPSRQADDWSKPFAVATAFLAPILCAFVLSDGAHAWKPYLWASIISLTCGLAALFLTNSSRPPKRFALPWVLGGFLMSVVWFYIIANELVAVLVAIGVILEIDSALLGLTVLAWGNSIGDAVANLAMACSGSPDSVQIAWSGCYAGPMFNNLVGIGSSLVLASWKTFPNEFLIPSDPTLLYTMLFLLVGLFFSLGVMPLYQMRFSKVLGIGLIGLYLSFMTLRVLYVIGVVSLPGL